jgi:hypothetical protein
LASRRCSAAVSAACLHGRRMPALRNPSPTHHQIPDSRSHPRRFRQNNDEPIVHRVTRHSMAESARRQLPNRREWCPGGCGNESIRALSMVATGAWPVGSSCIQVCPLAHRRIRKADREECNGELLRSQRFCCPSRSFLPDFAPPHLHRHGTTDVAHLPAAEYALKAETSPALRTSPTINSALSLVKSQYLRRVFTPPVYLDYNDGLAKPK